MPWRKARTTTRLAPIPAAAAAVVAAMAAVAAAVPSVLVRPLRQVAAQPQPWRRRRRRQPKPPAPPAWPPRPLPPPAPPPPPEPPPPPPASGDSPKRAPPGWRLLQLPPLPLLRKGAAAKVPSSRDGHLQPRRELAPPRHLAAAAAGPAEPGCRWEECHASVASHASVDASLPTSPSPPPRCRHSHCQRPRPLPLRRPPPPPSPPYEHSQLGGLPPLLLLLLLRRRLLLLGLWVKRHGVGRWPCRGRG